MNSLIKAGSPIPRDFSKNGGSFELSPIPFSKEGPSSWVKLGASDDQKKKTKARTLLLTGNGDAVVPSKKSKAGSSNDLDLGDAGGTKVRTYTLSVAPGTRKVSVEVPANCSAVIKVETKES